MHSSKIMSNRQPRSVRFFNGKHICLHPLHKQLLAASRKQRQPLLSLRCALGMWLPLKPSATICQVAPAMTASKTRATCYWLSPAIFITIDHLKCYNKAREESGIKQSCLNGNTWFKDFKKNNGKEILILMDGDWRKVFFSFSLSITETSFAFFLLSFVFTFCDIFDKWALFQNH